MKHIRRGSLRSIPSPLTVRCTPSTFLKPYTTFKMSSGKTVTLNTGYKIPYVGVLLDLEGPS